MALPTPLLAVPNVIANPYTASVYANLILFGVILQLPSTLKELNEATQTVFLKAKQRQT